jgi:hypothetical protein
MRRRIIAGLIVAVGLATAGIAYAEGQPADPAITSPPPAAAQGGAARAGGVKAGVLKGAIHGDLLVRAEDGSTRNVTFDKGKVTAISEESITVERPDGISVSKRLTDQTTFKGVARDQLQPGAAVVVVSSGDTAERVISKGARGPRLEKGQERLDRRQKRLEQKQERREQKQERREQKQERRERPAGETPAAPSSIVDDGLKTVVS